MVARSNWKDQQINVKITEKNIELKILRREHNSSGWIDKRVLDKSLICLY